MKNQDMKGFYEVEPLDTDAFLKVKETLTRIGVASHRADDEKPTLWQSCHVLQKRGKYYICHFKQLFVLDNKKTTIDDEDLDRVEFVLSLLEEWGLVKAVYPVEKARATITVVPYNRKNAWNLRSKYTIGGNKHES